MNHPREKTVEEMEKKTREVNEKIDEFQQKLETLPRKYSEEGQALINDLKAKKARFENRIEKLKHTTSKSYGDMRAGVELAWDDLKVAVSSAKDRFASQF